MSRLLFFFACLLLTIPTMAQEHPITITLSPFIKKEGQSEELYLKVKIKSNIADSITIDDTRSWMECREAIGVKLITQILEGDCYQEAGADCDPTYNTLRNGITAESKILPPFGEFSYDVRVAYMLRVEETGLKRTLRNFNPYRFKIELPYKSGNNWGTIVSKDWVYYAYPR